MTQQHVDGGHEDVGDDKQEAVSAVNEPVEEQTDDPAPPSADPVTGPDPEGEGRASPTNIIREKFEQVRVSAYVAMQMEKTHSNAELEVDTMDGLDNEVKIEENALEAASEMRESVDPRRITEVQEAHSKHAEQQADEARRELEEFKAKEEAAQAMREKEIEEKNAKLRKEMEEFEKSRQRMSQVGQISDEQLLAIKKQEEELAEQRRMLQEQQEDLKVQRDTLRQ